MGQNILINQAHTIIIFYSKHDLNLMGKKRFLNLPYLSMDIFILVFLFFFINNRRRVKLSLLIGD